MLGLVATPRPQGGSGTPAGGAKAPGQAQGSSAERGLLSDLVVSITGPDEVSPLAAVLATNFLLTLLIVLLFGITSSLFNSTIDENRAEIDGWFVRLLARLAPIVAVLGTLRAAARRINPDGKLSRRERMVRIGGVLAATAFIYGFLSPDFTLDARSALLIASLVVGLGIVTFLAEGGSAIIATHRLGARSSVELYAAAIAVAIICVVLSRLVNFHPGIVYGFVASNLMVAPAVLSRRQSAQVVIIPALGLLVASLSAWVLLLPLQPAAEANGGWLLVLLDSIAGIVFVAGLEGLFYSMIPLTFLDGKVVFDWSPWVWASLFGTATFLFWQLVINQDAAYLDAFRQTRVVTAIVLVAIYAVITFGTWAFFRIRESRAEGHELEAVGEREH